MKSLDLVRLAWVLPLKLLASPLTLLALLFLKPGYGLEDKGGNVSVLLLPKYLAFCLGFFLLTQILLFGISQVALLTGSPGPALVSGRGTPLESLLFQLGQWHWPHVAAWLLTLFVLNLYRTGMEGNIMGFFGFPILLLALTAQTLASWSWLTQSLWQSIVQLSQPLIATYSGLPWLQQASLTLVLSPITVYLFRSLMISNQTQAGYAGNLALSLLSALITTALLAAAWGLLLWVAHWLTAEKTGIGSFFLGYLAQIHPSTVLASALTALGYGLVVWESLAKSGQTQGDSGFVPAQILVSFLVMLASGTQTLLGLWRR